MLDWTYNLPGLLQDIADAGFEFTSVVPSDGVYGSYYAQGVVAGSPHPNAGRLWIEHILSDEGALGYLEGGAIPARYATLVENGVITEDMLANLPPAELIEQIAFPTARPDRRRPGSARRELGADGRRRMQWNTVTSMLR